MDHEEDSAVIDDALRKRSVELLTGALEGDCELPEEARDPEVIAMEIEQKLYDLCKNGLEYRSRVRSHIFNLRSKHNQTLRHLVLKGMITPSTFAEMKSEDMAPEGIRELREEYEKAALVEHVITDEGMPTTAYECNRCHSNNCVFNQAKSHTSSDDAVKVVVTCEDCGSKFTM